MHILAQRSKGRNPLWQLSYIQAVLKADFQNYQLTNLSPKPKNNHKRRRSLSSASDRQGGGMGGGELLLKTWRHTQLGSKVKGVRTVWDASSEWCRDSRWIHVGYFQCLLHKWNEGSNSGDCLHWLYLFAEEEEKDRERECEQTKKRQQGHVDLELLSRSVTSYTNCKEIWSCQTIKTRLIKLSIVSFVDSRSLLIYFRTFEKAFFTFFLQKHQKTQRFTILWLAAESRSWLTFWLGIRISEAAVNWCWQTTT